MWHIYLNCGGTINVNVAKPFQSSSEMIGFRSPTKVLGKQQAKTKKSVLEFLSFAV